MKYTHLLLDLDGTVTDSMIGITRSVQYALKHFGIEVNDLNILRPFIGPPLKDSFKEYYNFTEEQASLAALKYHEYFSSKGIFENAVYPGIKDFLQKQKEENKKVLLATSKPEPLAKQILDHFELSSLFDFIGGATFDDSRSEKKDVIQYVIESNNLINRTKECIMIGDRRHDIEGAKANHISSIGVLYGYGSREELLNADADYIVNDLQELYKILI
ncbi:HAD family hydrolase [Coprobacter sp.]